MSIEYFLSLVLSLLACAEYTEANSLRHVHILFRHGDRTPISVFPEDGHPVGNTWPEGLGQLTQIGIEQQFVLGKWLRNRYQSFLPTEYNESVLYMRSTDVDRTLMSALANLAGLYSESNSSLAKYGLHWRPIPVHTVKHESEIMFANAPCPRFEELVNQSFETTETKAFLAQHQTLLSQLRNGTGLADLTFRDIWSVEDDLICLESHNLTLPAWVTPALRTELMQFSDFFWNLRYTDYTLLRFEAGVFVNDAVKNMKHLIEKGPYQPISSSIPLSKIQPKPVMAYSAHDDNVAALLGALGLYRNESKPRYASLVIIELMGPEFPSPSSDYRVRVLYKRGWTDSTGEYLQFPACISKPAIEGCEFDKVLSQLEPILLTEKEFRTSCHLNDIAKTQTLFIAVICFLLVFVTLIVFIAFSALLYKRLIRRSLYRTFSSESVI